ncbi:MAG: hypothetical protein GXO83_03415 [Chlorobi bacterium]|nr:hypothetical protein [Chlorobiota bacterium]
MNRIVSGIFLILILTAVMAGGCKKNKDEKPTEVIPKVLDFEGPTDVIASGMEALEYSVAYRAGSSYEFTSEGWPAQISVPDTAYPNRIRVIWQQADQDTSALLICVETSTSGNVSEPDTLFINILRFCVLTIDDFSGTWTGLSKGDSEDTLTVEIVVDPGAGANTLRVKHIYDTVPGGGEYLPPFMQSLFNAWGERFVPVKGNEGDVLLHINLLSGKLIIENDYWGQTLPGPFNYWTGGDGSWAGCDTSMHINFELYLSTNFSKPNMTGSIDLKKQ